MAYKYITEANTLFKKKMVLLQNASSRLEYNVVNVYPHIKKQSIIGFGGALTQATASLITDDIIDDYFNELNYKIIRIPIGSCDFSQKSYSYSYQKDLNDFSIKEDLNIINNIKKIKKINPHVQILASPWSPPAFMKSNKMLCLGGKLKKAYYSIYALYLVKYLLAYQKEGINIDYITIQNETGAITIWESCVFDKEEEMLFIKQYFKPLLEQNNLHPKILIHDHNKEKLVDKMAIENSQDIAGIAMHSYTGDHFDNISLIHELYSDKLIIHSEGCTSYTYEDNFNDAYQYAHDIIGDFNNGCHAYIDWNMVLDYKGGPNHVKNYCNSPIMLDKNNIPQKRLLYTYIRHFSSFIDEDTSIIATSKYSPEIEVLGFVNKKVYVVVFNSGQDVKEINIVIGKKVIKDHISPKSIITYEV